MRGLSEMQAAGPSGFESVEKLQIVRICNIALVTGNLPRNSH